MFSPRLLLALSAFVLAARCGGSAPPSSDTKPSIDSATPQDSGLPADSALKDPGLSFDQTPSVDSEPPQPDVPVQQETSSPINGYLETAFGTIDGACGLLDPEITAATPSFFISTYTFHDDYVFDIEDYSDGPKARFLGGNAGGSSGCSEVISMQFMADCQGATIIKTENEILYRTEGKETDYIASIDGYPVGISVTRAYMGPFVTEYTLEDAVQLLEKKLNGVNESSLNVHPDDAWIKQILHIWTLHLEWANTVQQAWNQMSDELKADTILLMSVELNSTIFVTDTCGD